MFDEPITQFDFTVYDFIDIEDMSSHFDISYDSTRFNHEFEYCISNEDYNPDDYKYDNVKLLYSYTDNNYIEFERIFNANF